MLCRSRLGFASVLWLLLTVGCGSYRIDPTIYALCQATCERLVECSPGEPVDVCISECVDFVGPASCNHNQAALDSCVTDIAVLTCEALAAGELPPSCQNVCTGEGPCDDVVCDDDNDCTEDSCNPTDGSCDNTPRADWTSCSSGACYGGMCGTVFPCTEQGVRDAIEVGVGPFTFACEGLTTVRTQDSIVVDRDVILDGEGNLTLHGSGKHLVLSVPSANVELRNMTVTGGWSAEYDGAAGIDNHGTLTLASVTLTRNFGRGAGAIFNDGALTLKDSDVSNNEALLGGGIRNHENGILVLNDSNASRNSAVDGGGIYNEGTVTLTGTTISENRAQQSDGGGIFNGPGAILMLSDCAVSENVAGRDGGGIRGFSDFFDQGDSVITVIDSVVSGNSAMDVGGGIANVSATLTLLNSTVSENTANAGGGIYSARRLSVTDSVVSGNTAENGGGIGCVGPADFTLSNSTVSANTANNRGGGISSTCTTTVSDSAISGNAAASGGGIESYDSHAALTMTNSTLSGNVGGGIRKLSSSVTLIHNTIFGNDGFVISNSGSGMVLRNNLIVGECDLGFSDPSSGGGNIESPGNTCELTDPSDEANVTAEQLDLGPLQDNGGRTLTHLPGPGSVAVDVIPQAACIDADGAPLTTDQRGVARPQGPTCDVGAVEVVAVVGTD